MKKNSFNDSLIARFPLLSIFGAVFCFIVVPFALLNLGLERMFQIRSEKEKTEIFKQMDNRLEFLLRHSDDQHYFHAVFKRVFTRAIASKDPVKSIEQSIKYLRKRFPEGLSFLVWDEKGKKIEHLSDEKRYRYIVRNLYQMFQEVAAHCRNNYPGFPETLPIVTDKINLFRNYLGRFLVPSHLRLPFQAGVQGACIHADSEDRNPLFWFHADARLTFLCFISGNLVNQNSGLKHALEILNRSSRIVSGIIVDNKVFPETSPDTTREILIEMGKFENASLPHRATEENFFAFKQLSPTIRGFCRQSIDSLPNGRPGQLKHFYLSRVIIATFLLLFVFYCYQLRLDRIRISIRFKLAMLFLYATGLPLMILGTIGYEYLQQQRFNLITETHADNERLLLELDSGYDRFRRSLSQKAKQKLKEFRQKTRYEQPDGKHLELYNQLLEQLEADEIHIFNQAGQTLISHKRYRKPASQTFMKVFAAGALTFANQKTNEQFDQLVENAGASLRLAGKQVLQRGAGILQTLLSKLEQIENFNFGTEIKLCYTTLLGDPANRNFHSFLIIVWREDEAQASYARSRIEQFNRQNSNILLAANVLANGSIISPGISSSRKILPVLQKAAALQNYHEDSLEISGKAYIASAIGGKALHHLSLIALAPASIIDKQIELDKFYLAVFIVVSLALSFGVALSLSQQFLEPVKQLSQAVVQIGQRNFRYRTQIACNDEFGDLGKVFNSSIEELETLEIGRVVQENLFPGNHFRQGPVEIFARTVTMTRLGGDYYDFFSIEDGLTGIFVGDVAGHGIPAALIMAMAKASVLSLKQERKSPDQLLSRIHQMLYSLKSSSFKRMMTCQYMTLSDQGRLTLANAGHCFPILVKAGSHQTSYQEIVGTPVGITKRSRYTNLEFDLDPGDTLILYSDGLIEASNEESGVFGAERLLQLSREAWHENLEQYYNHIFSVNQNWAANAEDDLTVVLLRYHGKEISNA